MKLLVSETSIKITLIFSTIDVRKPSIKQLVVANESKYLKRLRDETNNARDINLHAVLIHLFDFYGKVDSGTLIDIEDRVGPFNYSPTDPLVTFLNEIKELARLGQVANNPYSGMQKGQLDYELSKTQTTLNKVAEHTWKNFKDHFEDVRKLLRRIRGVWMQNTTF